ncbi:MAG: peptide chain release factor N(5)-glutamine methyltransferase [Chitinophagaceae bacterium]
MTIHEAALQLRFQLFHLYDEREAGNIAELVMEHITGWQKIDRVVNKTAVLSGQQAQLLQSFTDELQTHKPLQYVLQEAWFYGMRLYVDENVLIPRPETEELVDWLIKEARKSAPPVRSVLDIGTGSGCIPLAIKKNLPAVEMYSCDISEGALQVAKRNAATHNLDIHFHALNILVEQDRNQLPLFDAIISNPPYIPVAEKAAMAANVLAFEPSLALFVPDDQPLLFYSAIAEFALAHLAASGIIYLEIHEALGAAVVALLKEKGFSGITIRKDLQGRDRMIQVRR